MNQESAGRSTQAIHGARITDAHGAPHLPIYNTTTFSFENTAALLEVVDGRRKGALYTRYGQNPTIFALEQTMAAIEGADSALAFCSGMAAETALFAQYGRDGIVCVGDAYGGTMELLGTQLAQLGITTTFLLGDELDRLEDVLRDGARLVFFETPTNPALDIHDITAISGLAHRYGATVAVDNTFASPVNQRPLELGADLVSYSATKFLGGHSDVTAGFVLGSAELVAPLNAWRKSFGSCIAPEPAAQLSRSLRTLIVRVRQHNANALAVAKAMEADPRITRVLYPGLESFPGHSLAARQMSGFGGIVTIEVDGDSDAAVRVVDGLRVFTLAPSLGGVESLVTQPVTTTHHDLSQAERERRGITGSMIRLSIGLEDADDLVADLLQALDAASG
ncbi:MAG: aminotransferase class I/II-fold pyridoxal phosphate-dependent enzyme [Rhodococcus sp.]|uniref:trans-sulfuration enzyme family protein n=1 Tax=Rhodococcus TaxID=1827 RepID=UPI0016A0BC7C|nr:MULTISPECIES: aminotransferase class I/II-fold pyridoxal phosphate-dependent enzyme [Rhodococcus]NLV79209.1 aminotransferase class I/II-fold pyridoxal phosphate-dependent enzyme [Rhodococcus sp. (in: high G+C Gram-positive bacteria)]